MTMRVGRDGVLGGGKTSSPSSQTDTVKFDGVCREYLYKDGSLPFGERKTCLQVAFLMGHLSKVLLRYF